MINENILGLILKSFFKEILKDKIIQNKIMLAYQLQSERNTPLFITTHDKNNVVNLWYCNSENPSSIIGIKEGAGIKAVCCLDNNSIIYSTDQDVIKK
jgi:hypothetical protein